MTIFPRVAAILAEELEDAAQAAYEAHCQDNPAYQAPPWWRLDGSLKDYWRRIAKAARSA